MQIFDTSQVHAWDEYTIANEPIASIDLMERAAKACFEWLMANGYQNREFSIYCGKGNNGGDGLALARMLSNTGHVVSVFILEFGFMGTADFQANLARLHDTEVRISYISGEENIHQVPDGHVLIDALLGSGLNRALDGLMVSVVNHLNNSDHAVISIDIPTGMFADKKSPHSNIVRANHTLSFQSYKLAFLVQENQQFIGRLHLLYIGLHENFLKDAHSRFHLVDMHLIHSILKPRMKFSHKGDYGSGALVTGSTGLMGASVLCSRAFMRSGAGKLTCHIPASGNFILQVAVPEAMSKLEKGTDHLESVTSLEKYDAVGIGPGIGLHDTHVKLLSKVFAMTKKPMVIDADALNMLSRSMELMNEIPALSVLTPHTREFERLFGTFDSDFDRIETAIQKAQQFNIVIVLKGPYTFIATPDGTGYFNNSGNPGMATGGSGDVLTGIITGLLCQGYPPVHAATMGVHVHGIAGDLAAAQLSQEALIASDIVDYLGQAFRYMVSNA